MLPKKMNLFTNIMIYKKPGNMHLERLHVIHFFKADFNLLVGLIFEHKALHYATDNKLVHRNQYGKPGGNAKTRHY